VADTVYETLLLQATYPANNALISYWACVSQHLVCIWSTYQALLYQLMIYSVTDSLAKLLAVEEKDVAVSHIQA